MTKKYLMTLWIICHGQKYKFLSASMSMKRLVLNLKNTRTCFISL